MRSVSGVGRMAAVAAVFVAAVLVGICLFGNAGGGGYTVDGRLPERRPAREGQPGADRRRGGRHA